MDLLFRLCVLLRSFFLCKWHISFQKESFAIQSRLTSCVERTLLPISPSEIRHCICREKRVRLELLLRGKVGFRIESWTGYDSGSSMCWLRISILYSYCLCTWPIHQAGREEADRIQMDDDDKASDYSRHSSRLTSSKSNHQFPVPTEGRVPSSHWVASISQTNRFLHAQLCKQGHWEFFFLFQFRGLQTQRSRPGFISRFLETTRAALEVARSQRFRGAWRHCSAYSFLSCIRCTLFTKCWRTRRNSNRSCFWCTLFSLSIDIGPMWSTAWI